MRKAFVEAFLNHAENRRVVFLTGDLGFMALEPIQERLQERFINCGIAEQNMIGVAAGMAKTGWEVWVYSIAPFCYARPFEQIRNDICFAGLPVHLVGNGGGYAYGVMGPTHHALEDYGILATLPGMTAYVPARDQDLGPMLTKIGEQKGPSYLRLGLDEFPATLDPFPTQVWRRIVTGPGPLVVTTGPVSANVWKAIQQLPPSVAPEMWIVSEFPILAKAFPQPLLEKLATAPPTLVVEEHVAQGGLGMQWCHRLLTEGMPVPASFSHLHALGYPSGDYGSQAFHRAESGLDVATICARLLKLAQRDSAGG